MATMKKASDASQTVPDSVCELWRKGAALSWAVEELSKEATERKCLLVCFSWKGTSGTHACVLCSVKVAGRHLCELASRKQPRASVCELCCMFKRHDVGFSLHILGVVGLDWGFEKSQGKSHGACVTAVSAQVAAALVRKY